MSKLATLIAAVVAVTALAVGAATARAADDASAANIVETAAAAGQFDTLLAAAKAAGLAETLAEGGPFTVFAPTDEAFAKLPAGTVEALLADPERLRAVLLYHVVSGAVPAAEVTKLDTAKTLNGARVDLRVEGGEVFVNAARVTGADVMASNGVVHVIDTVLIPPASILEIAKGAGSFKTLTALLERTGIDERILSGKGPFTVFAPTDAAFAKVPKATLAQLERDPKLLRRVLAYHVRNGDLDAAAVAERKGLWTAARRVLDVRTDGEGVRVDDARVVTANIAAANGVIHVIDRVLVPRV
jgi:transforming growth factor-beta-induced protein